MKLVCPKCSKNIPSTEINISKDLAHCIACSEVFNIAEYLVGSEEIRRIQKPHFSKVILNATSQDLRAIIPPAGWSGTAIFLLIFSAIWNAVIFGFLISQTNIGWFILPFIVVGLGTFAFFLFMIKSKIEIQFSPVILKVKWSFIGLSFTKKGKVANLDRFTEDVMYTQNYQPVYGIGIYFQGQGKIKFGSHLKEEERKWLIGEFYEFKDKLKAVKYSITGR